MLHVPYALRIVLAAMGQSTRRVRRDLDNKETGNESNIILGLHLERSLEPESRINIFSSFLTLWIR